MIDKKSFKKSVAAPLEAEHFVKRGQSWYLDGADALAVVNLQKNDWAEEYFINIGIWLKALGEATFPLENQCHLSHRVEALFPSERDMIRKSTSLENGTAELLDVLSGFIANQLIPFLRDCTDEHNLRQLLASGRFAPGFVRQDARRYLANQERTP